MDEKKYTTNGFLIVSESYTCPLWEKDTKPCRSGWTRACFFCKYADFRTEEAIRRAEEMPRGAKVSLLGELQQGNRTYYEIAYAVENGEVKTGYIPTAYVNLFDGTDPAFQTVTYGETADDTDAVGRLIYILLGFGAIGILLDVLLLKKTKETDDN